jgi:predicted nucleic acid-binding protein
VKRYVREAGTASVQALLRRAPRAAARLSEVEVASAVCRRSREGLLSPVEREELLVAVREDLASFVVVELSPEVVARARRLLTVHPLRSADAIQLASALVLADASGEPVTFVAFDAALCRAATSEGLRLAGTTVSGRKASPLTPSR